MLACSPQAVETNRHRSRFEQTVDLRERKGFLGHRTIHPWQKPHIPILGDFLELATEADKDVLTLEIQIAK